MTTTHNTLCGARGSAAILLGAAVLACCGACGHRWTFARPEYPGPISTPAEASLATPAADAGSGSSVGRSPTASPVGRSPTASPVGRSPTASPVGRSPTASPVGRSPTASIPGRSETPSYKSETPSYEGEPSSYTPARNDAGNIALLSFNGDSTEAALPPFDSALIEPLPPITDEHHDIDLLRGGPRLRSMWQQAKRNVRQDYINYYSWDNLRDLALGIAVAAPMANTSLDGSFRDWYQDDVRSRDTDNAAKFFKTFGEGQIFIPSFALLAITGQYFADRPLLGTAGDYSGRVTRAYLVGAPPMLLMQYVTGAGRPGESEHGSYWQPFKDNNGVSGHAFMGSVPFITAARMVENPFAKATLYGLSTFTGWSRINDDDHYLSQVVLGWWMGYLACRAVDDTQLADKRLTLTPVATPGMVGVAMVYQR